ncbi:hypothetical protein FHETE_7013 [Fusarium heterosporum]|uniref:Uncharacterized protein n=1 Tax=Fusarium heterosporum TaxID=42747 RepID=A0A8H5WLY1_FUSHE|nr:hypothetical protein FHETE_7013 [Fusarium heterosporum]
MAYATGARDSSTSTRSGGGSMDPQFSAATRAPGQNSLLTLTASSASSVSSGSQHQSGGVPSTPASRRSGGWDRQTLSPAAAARVRVDDDDQPSVPRSKEGSRDDLDDSSDSSAEYMSSYRVLEKKFLQAPTSTGSRSKRFFQSFVKKFNKSSVRYGLVPNSQQEQDRNAQKYPHCSVLGVDIEPVKPPYTRPNCSFMTMDITHDWDLPDGGDFDFIHIRQLGDIHDKRALLQSAFNNLRPGGWVELTEWIAHLHSPNHSLNGTAFRRWNDLLEQGMRNMGTSVKYPNKFKPLLQEIGFERIIETRNGAPTNSCYPGKKLQRIGHLMTQNWLLILEPLTMPVFTQALGWSPEQVKTFLSDVRKEIGNTKYHSFMTLAQKPSDGASMSLGSPSASVSEASLPKME